MNHSPGLKWSGGDSDRRIEVRLSESPDDSIKAQFDSAFLRATFVPFRSQQENLMPATIVKVNLDRVAAAAVHQVAIRESRSASNAASVLIKEAINHRRSAAAARTDATAS